jgi:catecholate siderophore receptor
MGVGQGGPTGLVQDDRLVSSYSDPAKLAWGTTILSLASAMLLTDSAEAQQSQDALPTIQVTPPPRVRAQPRPKRQARQAPAQPATSAPGEATQTAATGPGTGYQAAQPGLSRIPTPLRDTPQIVNVVTQQEIRDRAIVTMEDALRGIPGITFNAGEGGLQGDSPVIRGFVSRTDIFRDGVRDPGWYTRDLFSIDRVEVYKGPSAFAFGRGSTGGAINNVSKLPQGQNYFETTNTVATPLGYRSEVDASGKSGNVSARIAAVAQDLQTASRDNVEAKRYGFAPSVQVDVTDKTKVTGWYIFQYEDSVPDYGHPYLPTPVYSSVTGALTHRGYYPDARPVTPVPIPRSNWFGVVAGPLRDRVETETHILTGKVEHEFMPDVKVTNTTRYFENDRLARPSATSAMPTT